MWGLISSIYARIHCSFPLHSGAALLLEWRSNATCPNLPHPNYFQHIGSQRSLLEVCSSFSYRWTPQEGFFLWFSCEIARKFIPYFPLRPWNDNPINSEQNKSSKHFNHNMLLCLGQIDTVKGLYCICYVYQFVELLHKKVSHNRCETASGSLLFKSCMIYRIRGATSADLGWVGKVGTILVNNYWSKCTKLERCLLHLAPSQTHPLFNFGKPLHAYDEVSDTAVPPQKIWSIDREIQRPLRLSSFCLILQSFIHKLIQWAAKQHGTS